MKVLILGLLISSTCLGETVTYTKIGDTVFGSDGSRETKIGDTVFVHKPDTGEQREESGENARQMGVAVGNLIRRLFTSPPPPPPHKEQK